jgi:hypothetical protein
MTPKERRNHWLSLVEKQSESGVSAAAFCKVHELKIQQFYAWRRRLNPTGTDESPFIRLIPASKGKESGIRILLGQTMAIELDQGFDPPTLRTAVECLRSRN